MAILVTNDDGVDSEGLQVLARRLAESADVVVFAPSGEYSGAGTAIGHLGPGLPEVHRVERDDYEGVSAVYHLDGPPALASLLACQGLFGELPELVVSGINPGWNVGFGVHFSGTVGACVTSSILGIPGIAVSQKTGQGQQWASAAEAAVDVMADIGSAPRVLNVNVPNLPYSEFAGVKSTLLSDRIPYGLHNPQLSPGSTSPQPNTTTYQASFDRVDPLSHAAGTDTEAVQDGFVSITELAPMVALLNE